MASVAPNVVSITSVCLCIGHTTYPLQKKKRNDKGQAYAVAETMVISSKATTKMTTTALNKHYTLSES